MVLKIEILSFPRRKIHKTYFVKKKFNNIRLIVGISCNQWISYCFGIVLIFKFMNKLIMSNVHLNIRDGCKHSF